MTPLASMAVNRSPFGWCICAPGGNIVSRWKSRSPISSKAMGRSAGEIETARDADVLHGGVNSRGIDGGWLVTGQSEQHGAIGSVTQAGERQRSVQVDLYAGYAVQNSAPAKLARKTAGGLHGTHGV